MAADDAVLKGFLLKMKRTQNKFLPQWNRRWFELQGNTLLWFKRKGGQASGMINLSSCTSIDKFESGKQGIYSFVVRSSQRNIYLRAESESQMTYWRSGLLLQMDLMAGGTAQGPPTRNNQRKVKKHSAGSDAFTRAMESLKELEDILAAEEKGDCNSACPHPIVEINSRGHSERTTTNTDSGRTDTDCSHASHISTVSTMSTISSNGARTFDLLDRDQPMQSQLQPRRYGNRGFRHQQQQQQQRQQQQQQQQQRSSWEQETEEEVFHIHSRGEGIVTPRRPPRQGPQLPPRRIHESPVTAAAPQLPPRNQAHTHGSGSERSAGGTKMTMLDIATEDLDLCHLDLLEDELRWPEAPPNRAGGSQRTRKVHQAGPGGWASPLPSSPGCWEETQRQSPEERTRGDWRDGDVGSLDAQPRADIPTRPQSRQPHRPSSRANVAWS